MIRNDRIKSLAKAGVTLRDIGRQFALAAIDATLSNGSELTVETPMIAAYEALQAALAE